VLQRRSKVYQTTGLDWNKVNLTLSTAQPSRGKDAPLFQTWFLNYIYANNALREYDSGSNATQNTISYDEKKEVSGTFGAAPKIRVRGASSIHGEETPLYVVDGVITETMPDINPDAIENVQILKDASATAIYGARAMSGVVLITTKKMEDYVLTEEKQISEEYKIDLPYTIPGNGKEQIIDLKKNELQATYKYYCAPKLDANVYLIAEFTDWEKLNLLSGQANVTYDGTFVGQTFLNAQSAQKTLYVTLGTDKRVIVKREKMMDYSSVKTFSSDTKVTLTYKISVKNNQNKPVFLVLKDQYPISQQKDIEVEFLKKETTTPTVNKEETGVITWETNLSAGESKEYRIAYSVKYPKGRKINL
jgi:TonB-dependent SusC/RagA subfamily outer membrane receptor